MRTHGAVVGRRFRSVTKLTTKVRIGRGYLWGSFLIAAAALKTPTRNGYNAQGVNLNIHRTRLVTTISCKGYILTAAISRRPPPRPSPPRAPSREQSLPLSFGAKVQTARGTTPARLALPVSRSLARTLLYVVVCVGVGGVVLCRCVCVTC